MFDKSLIYTVEYSAEQDAFHVDTLDNVITANLRQMIGVRPKNDYALVAICNSHDEAHAIANAFRQHIGRHPAGTQHAA